MQKYIKNKILVILISAVLLNILLLVLWFFLIYRPSSKTLNSPVLFQSTGAELTTDNPEKFTNVNLIWQIKSQTPITGSGFEIHTDYAANKLVVTIQPPSEVNYPHFLEWLTTNSYQQLPLDSFHIIKQ